MKRGISLSQKAVAWTLGAAVTLCGQAAVLACEGCKQAMRSGNTGSPNAADALSATSIGYGWSVLFLLAMAFSVVGTLGWMMYRSCRALEAAHAAAEHDLPGVDSVRA